MVSITHFLTWSITCILSIHHPLNPFVRPLPETKTAAGHWRLATSIHWVSREVLENLQDGTEFVKLTWFISPMVLGLMEVISILNWNYKPTYIAEVYHLVPIDSRGCKNWSAFGLGRRRGRTDPPTSRRSAATRRLRWKTQALRQMVPVMVI